MVQDKKKIEEIQILKRKMTLLNEMFDKLQRDIEFNRFQFLEREKIAPPILDEEIDKILSLFDDYQTEFPWIDSIKKVIDYYREYISKNKELWRIHGRFAEQIAIQGKEFINADRVEFDIKREDRTQEEFIAMARREVKRLITESKKKKQALNIVKMKIGGLYNKDYLNPSDEEKKILKEIIEEELSSYE